VSEEQYNLPIYRKAKNWWYWVILKLQNKGIAISKR